MLKNSDNSVQVYRRRISAAMNFISENLFRNPSLEEIARSAHFSKFHFHRLFRAYTGETVAEFTRRIRLEQAVNLLCYHPQKSVTDIAYDCGFSSSQNFAKQCTKHFGIPPSQLRHNFLTQMSREEPHPLPSPLTGETLSTVPKALSPSATNKPQALEVHIQPQLALNIAYIRFIGPYRSETTRACIEQLIEVLMAHQVEISSIVGVAWDNPEVTPLEKCRYDIGVLVQPKDRIPDELSVQQLPAGDYAVYRCEVNDNDLERPWDDLIRHWLPSSGYILSGSPGYEVFHNYALTDPSASWEMEIYLPLVPL